VNLDKKGQSVKERGGKALSGGGDDDGRGEARGWKVILGRRRATEKDKACHNGVPLKRK